MITVNEIQDLVSRQKEFFASGKSLDIDFRRDALQKLKAGMFKYEQEILDAVQADLRRPFVEGYEGELSVVGDINLAMKNLKKWMKPEKVGSSIFTFPSNNYIFKEPYGVSLIISPWNYPFQLTFVPLIGAIAAGNCSILKPSEISSNSSAVMSRLIKEAFDENYIAVIEGDSEVAQWLLDQKFDYIFFTGGTVIGKVVMEKAAKHLTPVTLELGGKSPCIVDKDIDLDKTAKRILLGKYVNNGQTCVAPDYLIVHKEIKKQLYAAFKKWLTLFYSQEPVKSPDLTRIINQRHFQRLEQYLTEGEIIIGGESDENLLYIAPTIMEVSDLNARVMNEEVFGPILPVVEFTSFEDIENIIRRNPNPLALYIYTRNKAMSEKCINRIPFGGGCVNTSTIQLLNPHLPFGGRGNSGIGNYHGKFTFDAFSRQKGVLMKSFGFEPNLIYPPYKNTHKLFKKMFMR